MPGSHASRDGLNQLVAAPAREVCSQPLHNEALRSRGRPVKAGRSGVVPTRPEGLAVALRGSDLRPTQGLSGHDQHDPLTRAYLMDMDRSDDANAPKTGTLQAWQSAEPKPMPAAAAAPATQVPAA